LERIVVELEFHLPLLVEGSTVDVVEPEVSV
jgi:hypothetical protein